MGKRPDYATVVYGNLIRQTYKKTPIILGGIEASLRRMAHYDYWSDKLKRSVLLGFRRRSDFLWNGRALDRRDRRCTGCSGIDVKDITYIDGTVCQDKEIWTVYMML